MSDQHTEVEGHIDASVRPAERRAVDEGQKWKVELSAIPGSAQLIGRYRNRRKSRWRLRLEEAEALRKLRRDKPSESHIIGEHHQPDMRPRRLPA